MGGVASPVMNGLSGTIPATVKSRDGSSWVISDALARRWCPWCSK